MEKSKTMIIMANKTEIHKYNKIIAEYMGGKLKPYNQLLNIWHWDYSWQPPNLKDGLSENRLHFHDTYEWLIPAWAKFYTNEILPHNNDEGDEHSYLVIIRLKFHRHIDKGEIVKAFSILGEGIQICTLKKLIA